MGVDMLQCYQVFLWCFLGSDDVSWFRSSFIRRLGVRRFESDVIVCSTYSLGLVDRYSVYLSEPVPFSVQM
jgi:hypothetical protein